MAIDQAIHRELGVSTNGEVWSLLEKTDRSDAENRRMVHAAHTSHYHWLHAGDAVNEQRGEWLISRTYVVLGFGEAALRHALRCVELTEEHKSKMKDFDVAFSVEALARAHAALGKTEEAKKLKLSAAELGNTIADPEDKKIYVEDLAGGNWYGVE